LAPQFTQNFISGTVSPHFGHCTRLSGYKARPQYPQNLKSSAFFPPQLKQTITILEVLLVEDIALNIYGTRKSPKPKPKPAETASPTSIAVLFAQINSLRHHPK
jgi:hypothetical protein